MCTSACVRDGACLRVCERACVSPDLLLEDVYRGLVGLQLLVLQEDLAPELEGRGEQRVI